MSFHTLISRLSGAESRKLQRRLERAEMFISNYANGVITAARGRGRSWMNMPDDADAANREYAIDRAAIMQRMEELDVNNPDVGGFHRTRAAQILGAGVRFKHKPKLEELKKFAPGFTDEKLAAVSEQLDRLRKQHSENGGFDCQRGQRWEGKQQERAMLTAEIYGQCLVHRVASVNRGVVPFTTELIPGCRISTPPEKMGDPLVSFGVRYTDNHRKQVAGYYVRRVSKTIGNSFVPDYTWALLPVEDCAILDMTESAGIDQSLPLMTRDTRSIRNLGEFIESTVRGAAAQATHYAAIECAKNDDPYNRAQDDRTRPLGSRDRFRDDTDNVKKIYTANGEKLTFLAASLPGPQFADFLDKMLERMGRGACSSKGRFTRTVTNSFAAGRMEEQQDDPIIAQHRVSFLACWHIVNGWFLDAVYLSGLVEMAGFNPQTRLLWNEFEAEFPAKVDINPQDTAAANEMDLMQRASSPQRKILATGKDPQKTLEEWGDWYVLTRAIEKKKGLPEGSLDVLFRGRALTTMAGEDVQPNVKAEVDPTEDDPDKKKKPAKKESATQSGAKGHANGNGHKSIQDEFRAELLADRGLS